METVLATHLAYLTASHLQLQEAYRVNVGSVLRTNEKADLTQEITKVAVSGIANALSVWSGDAVRPLLGNRPARSAAGRKTLIAGGRTM